MGGVIDQVKSDVEKMKKTVTKNTRLVESSLVLMKHVNARVDAMLAIAEKAGILNKAEFDMLVDHNLGLRLKTPEEEIANGDVCFVKYTGKDTVTGEEFGDEIPVRIGPNVIVFEKDLVGLKPGMTGVKRSYDFPEHKKTIEFTIDIVKVKTKIKPEGVEDHDGEGTDGSGGEPVEASAEAEAQPVGGNNGDEQPGDGGSVQPIRPEGSADASSHSSESGSGEHGPDHT